MIVVVVKNIYYLVQLLILALDLELATYRGLGLFEFLFLLARYNKMSLLALDKLHKVGAFLGGDFLVVDFFQTGTSKNDYLVTIFR
jgi:hypothetical protein